MSLLSFLFGTNSTSTTTPTLTPQGQGLYNTLDSSLSNILTDPAAGMAPVAAAGQQSINASYAGAPDIISRMMASRGYGSSGSMGNTMYQTDLSRLGSLSQFNGQMAQLESNRQLSSAGILNSMLSTQVGKTTQTSTTDLSSLFGGLGKLLTSGLIPGLGGAGGGATLDQGYSTVTDGGSGATWTNANGTPGGTANSSISYPPAGTDTSDGGGDDGQ